MKKLSEQMAKEQESVARSRASRQAESDFVADLHVKLDEVIDALNALHEGQCEIEERLETIEVALMAEGLGLDEAEVDD